MSYVCRTTFVSLAAVKACVMVKALIHHDRTSIRSCLGDSNGGFLITAVPPLPANIDPTLLQTYRPWWSH